MAIATEPHSDAGGPIAAHRSFDLDPRPPYLLNQASASQPQADRSTGMVNYTLLCAKQHSFASSFRDSDTYADLRRRRRIACPVCGSSSITKAPMAPAVSTSRGRGKSPAQVSGGKTTDADRARKALSALRKHVESTATDVGQTFPEEARKMHSGETEKRSIYGEASIAEARELREEGVPCLPLPWSSRDAN